MTPALGPHDHPSAHGLVRRGRHRRGTQRPDVRLLSREGRAQRHRARALRDHRGNDDLRGDRGAGPSLRRSRERLPRRQALSLAGRARARRARARADHAEPELGADLSRRPLLRDRPGRRDHGGQHRQVLAARRRHVADTLRALRGRQAHRRARHVQPARASRRGARRAPRRGRLSVPHADRAQLGRRDLREPGDAALLCVGRTARRARPRRSARRPLRVDVRGGDPGRRLQPRPGRHASRQRSAREGAAGAWRDDPNQRRGRLHRGRERASRRRSSGRRRTHRGRRRDRGQRRSAPLRARSARRHDHRGGGGEQAPALRVGAVVLRHLRRARSAGCLQGRPGAGDGVLPARLRCVTRRSRRELRGHSRRAPAEEPDGRHHQRGRRRSEPRSRRQGPDEVHRSLRALPRHRRRRGKDHRDGLEPDQGALRRQHPRVDRRRVPARDPQAHRRSQRAVAGRLRAPHAERGPGHAPARRLPAVSGRRLPPDPDFADYRSPVTNVYLCGAGSHPGSGITMGPGRNAAEAICGDLKLTFPGKTFAKV